MKKKIFSSVFAIALLATAGWGVNKSMKSDANLSVLALNNVEALAQNENPGTTWDCKTSNSIVCYWDSQGRVYGLFYYL